MDSGLSSLIRCSYQSASKALVSAFVERWQPETNTFHMPFGEMTITLDDVSAILSIPVSGRSLSSPTLSTDRDAVSLLHRALCVSNAVARDELSRVHGHSVRLQWLRDTFRAVTDAAGLPSVQFAARAYLLYVLGCTLFTDKSGTRVSIQYLDPLLQLDRIHTYAWGAAGLAHLYRQLGLATRRDVKQIAGYLTLLETWVYEHFRLFRPTPDLTYTIDLPLARRWTTRRESGSAAEVLQAVREQLDVLGIEEV